MHRTLLSVALGAALLAPFAAGAQPASAPPPVRVRGAIQSLSGNVLTVKTASGPIAVTLAPNVSVRAVVKSSLSDLKPGMYVGTAAKENPDGTLSAMEVHIFPEAARGTGEGHSPWDTGPGSSMTNGSVQDVEGATVSGVTGRLLTVTYKGGQQKVVVTPATPVVSYASADRSALVPGTKVFIVARRDASGVLGAANVTVGRNGVDPPM